MKRSTRILLYSVGGLAVFAVALLAAVDAMFTRAISGVWPWQRLIPIEYRIREGYQGWVQVRWAVAGASQLARTGRYLVVVVDSQGHAATSSPVQEGWAKDKYLYVSVAGERVLSETGWCKGGMIWGGAISADYHPENQNGKAVYRPTRTNMEEKFFVGPEDLYRKTVDPQAASLHPCR